MTTRKPSANHPAPPVPRFDPDQCRAFLRYTLDPAAGCMEVRAFRAKTDRGNFIRFNSEYETTMGAWFDDADDIVVDVGKFDGVSAYVTVNPVNRELLAGSRRSNNRNAPLLMARKRGQMTNDNDIAVIRWAYIDIDPKKPKSEMSATDDELAATVEARDRILDAEPDIRDASLWGRSGNGSWILARLDDLPNDADTTGMIHRFLGAILDKHGGKHIKKDTKTSNASRVMCLPGSVKCKGAHTADRPWRLVTLDGVGEGLIA